MDRTGVCICSVCGEEKDDSDYTFYNKRIDKFGYKIRVNKNCKSCRKRLGKDGFRIDQIGCFDCVDKKFPIKEFRK